MRSQIHDGGVWVALAAIAAIGCFSSFTYDRLEILNASAEWVHHSEEVRFTLMPLVRDEFPTVSAPELGPSETVRRP